MQVTKAEKLRLGIFIFTVIAMTVGILFYMMGKHLLKKEDSYYVKFDESVDGLFKAANVKLNGVIIGRVTDLKVDSMNVQKVIVFFAVEHGTPITTDMVANLSGGLNITGLKSLELSGGSKDSPRVANHGEVNAGVSQIKLLTGQAESIALKFETLINNFLSMTNERNQAKITDALTGIHSLTQSLDSLLIDNRDTFKKLPKSVNSFVFNMSRIALRTDTLLKEFNRAKIGRNLNKAIGEFEATGKEARKKIKNLNLNSTLNEFKVASKKISKAADQLNNTLNIIREDLGSSMRYIHETTENMADFSRMIRENPSLLLRSEEKAERDR